MANLKHRVREEEVVAAFWGPRVIPDPDEDTPPPDREQLSPS